MARPLEFDRSEALQQALEVFWENGYEGTSLRLLLRTMDLSRSSFYQSYGSKQRLYEQCLQQYTADVAQDMAEALEAAPSGLPFIEQVLYSIGAAVDEPKGRRGRMVMNASGGAYYARRHDVCPSVSDGDRAGTGRRRHRASAQ